MYAIPTTPMWGGSLQKNTLTLQKKERPALEGDTFNGCPYPPLQQPCSFYYITFLIVSEYQQWYPLSEILLLECIPSEPAILY